QRNAPAPGWFTDQHLSADDLDRIGRHDFVDGRLSECLPTAKDLGPGKGTLHRLFARDPCGLAHDVLDHSHRIWQPYRNTCAISHWPCVWSIRAADLDGHSLDGGYSNQYRGDCAHLPQCSSAHSALAQRAAGRNIGYWSMVRVNPVVWVVLESLCGL